MLRVSFISIIFLVHFQCTEYLTQDITSDATHMLGKDSIEEIQFTIHPVPRISAEDQQS